MNPFEVHTLESAPNESKPTLEAVTRSFGALPNLFGVFAESPAVVQGYAALGSVLEKSTRFSPAELQVVLLTTSFENNCEYCMAAHSTVANMQKVPQDVIQSLRDGRPIADARLEALRVFTRTVVEQRGWMQNHQVEAFLEVGFTKRHMLEVILGVAFKTISNFTNHLAETPVDAAFQRFAWSKPELTTRD